MTTQTIAEMELMMNDASLVFVHSVLDAAALDFCRVSAMAKTASPHRDTSVLVTNLGKCWLCLNDSVELRNSHYFPAAAYKS